MSLNVGRLNLERARFFASRQLIKDHPDLLSSAEMTISTPVRVIIQAEAGKEEEWMREETKREEKGEQEKRREEEKKRGGEKEKKEEEEQKKKQEKEERNREKEEEKKKKKPGVEVAQPNISLSALLAPFRFSRTHPHLFLFLYTLWILGLDQEGIFNLLNILIAPWILGNLIHSIFFHKLPKPTLPRAETVAVEEEGESGSEETDYRMPVSTPRPAQTVAEDEKEEEEGGSEDSDHKTPVPMPPTAEMVAEDEEEEVGGRVEECDWKSDESEGRSEQSQWMNAWRVQWLEQRVQTMNWRVGMQKEFLQRLERRREEVDRKLEGLWWRSP